MTARGRGGVAKACAALDADGLLLEADPRWPSVTTFVAGERVRGSWWGHAAGQAIYDATRALADSPDVVFVRLVNEKVTLVHRQLWPALVAVAGGAEPWQTRGLAAPAKRLLAHVRRANGVRSDRLPASLKVPPKAAGGLVRELERRLLVQTETVHTEAGAHAKVVTTWTRWARSRRVGRWRAPVKAAKALFEVILWRWALREGGPPPRLPWPPEIDLSLLPTSGRRGGRPSSTGR